MLPIKVLSSCTTRPTVALGVDSVRFADVRRGDCWLPLSKPVTETVQRSERRRFVLCRVLIAIFLVALLRPVSAYAQPARIIIVRHSEKLDDYALCDMGTARADALAKQYLGRGASQSLFGADGKPAAMIVMTAHTIDTITPSALSWNMPVTAYTVVPAKGGKNEAENLEENARTQDAMHDVMNDPRYSGKTVVVMWEHDRIANAKLETKYAGQQVTMRQLLHLDRIKGVPDTWPDENYDYFWIVDFARGKPVPVSFRMVRQVFTAPFDKLPANDWGTAEPQHIAAGCLK